MSLDSKRGICLDFNIIGEVLIMKVTSVDLFFGALLGISGLAAILAITTDGGKC